MPKYSAVVCLTRKYSKNGQKGAERFGWHKSQNGYESPDGNRIPKNL